MGYSNTPTDLQKDDRELTYVQCVCVYESLSLFSQKAGSFDNVLWRTVPNIMENSLMH